MKKISLLAILMLFYVTTNAQNLTIKGKVFEKKTNTALPFANVMHVSDSSSSAKLISGVTTDDKGEFTLIVKNQKPILKINSLGYKDNIFVVNSSNYQKEGHSINIGTIYLDIDAENLNEVSIIGKQTRIEMNQDKIVMNVDEGLSSTSSNVFEMLRKVPGVVIDKDENLTLQGQGNVLFQFDGRDIRIPYDGMKAILKGMSPNDVEKIETITNPSAKYEAEGTAGIINIVMTKQKTTGFSGDVNSWTGINESFKNNTGVNLNWVTKKWTVSTGANINKYSGRNSMEMHQYIWRSAGDTTLIHMDKVEDKYDFRGTDFNLSADYKINDNNSIGAMLSFNRNWSPHEDEPEHFTRISKFPYNVIDSSYSSVHDEESSSNNIMGSIYYNHKIDSLGGQYSAAIDFSHDISENISKMHNFYYQGNKNAITKKENLFNDADNKYNSYSAKLDFVKPFNEKQTLEFGVKSRLAIVDNNFEAKIDDIIDVSRTQAFKYKENVNAAYISFSNKVNEKFSWRIGLRSEHTYTYFDLKTTSQTHENNYLSLFPSLSINMKVGKMDNLSLSYTRRISRPEYNSLNPFVSKTSDYTYYKGNPYLDPEYTHKVSLNYAFRYMIFLTASYGYNANKINQTMMANPNTLILTQQPYNNGYSQDFNLGLSSMLPLGPVEWTLWMQGAYQQAKCDDPYLKVDISRFSFMTWQSLAIDFFFKTKLSLSCFYSTGGIQMGGEYDDMLMLSASLSKKFLNNALNISIGVDQLPKRDFHVNAYNKNYRLDMNMCWQWPQFTCNITYNFGKSSDNKTLKRIKTDDMDSRTGGDAAGGQGQIKGKK
ncbi:MAG: outer membrane beta-barrel protein [Bacteroidales bacterium]